METIFSKHHVLHQSPGELMAEGYVEAFEKPERAELILARINEVGLGPVHDEISYGIETILQIHDSNMVALLQNGAVEWRAVGRHGPAAPYVWGTRGMREDRVPRCLDGRLSYYCFDAGTPLIATSWQAIKASADTALTGSEMITKGTNSVFSLCRPPGHHAGSDHYGGYCFLNNAAIAVQNLLNNGAKRIAVLDVDYHHGNGTQQIFYARDDVLVVNIHADPDSEYPYRLGWAEEIGVNAGVGYNVNLPLSPGAEWSAWSLALEAGLRRIVDYGADAVVVSLGVDTYKGDPISTFLLDHDDFVCLGARIKSLGRPCLFVMEGGYAVAEIGINAVNVLTGFDGA